MHGEQEIGLAVFGGEIVSNTGESVTGEMFNQSVSFSVISPRSPCRGVCNSFPLGTMHNFGIIQH